MTKRTIKTTRAALWAASLALCCLAAFTFMRATQAADHRALVSLGRDPETTGSVVMKPMR